MSSFLEQVENKDIERYVEQLCLLWKMMNQEKKLKISLKITDKTKSPPFS